MNFGKTQIIEFVIRDTSTSENSLNYPIVISTKKK